MHPTPPQDPLKQHLGHRLVAGLISAMVAMLFLFLALPLGRQNQAGTTPEPTHELRVLPSEEEKAMSILNEAEPRDATQAQLWIKQLEPLLASLAQKAPESSRSAAEAWKVSAQHEDG